MELLYGTYLTHCVWEALRRSDGLTVKEIARTIHQYETRREQLNLQKRIRVSLRWLQEQQIVRREQDHTISNIIVYKYKFNSDETQSTRGTGKDGAANSSAHAQG